MNADRRRKTDSNAVAAGKKQRPLLSKKSSDAAKAGAGRDGETDARVIKRLRSLGYL